MHSLQSKFKFLIIRKIAPAVIKVASWFMPAADKTLLIIKNDGIGDYILFRNFLGFLKQSEKYKGYKIYLLGNIAFKDLATQLDRDAVDGFFWYTDGYFLKWKLLKLLADIQKLRLDTVIYTSYSRKSPVDWIVETINAIKKIAIDGDTINQQPLLKLKGDRYYTRLIKMPPQVMRLHEFEKNKALFEVITEQTCNYSKAFIDKKQLNILPDNNIVIFIGGSEKNKRWANKNQSELSSYIISKLNIPVVLAGGNDEMPDGLEIEQDVSKTHFTNKTGQLSLVQLCELIGGAKLLVSGDTVAIHIAAALSIPAVCVSKGDLYQRFIPYPDYPENSITTVFPPGFKADISNYNDWSPLNINSVQLNDVYAAIETTLNRYYPVINATS